MSGTVNLVSYDFVNKNISRGTQYLDKNVNANVADSHDDWIERARIMVVKKGFYILWELFLCRIKV